MNALSLLKNMPADLDAHRIGWVEDCLAKIDKFLGRKVHAVAHLANAISRFAGHRRTGND